ncbi:MerR family transcriptional regulator [Cohnella cholangitidis]|uniref:MerR family DNA-binding transcriptional regulator n=1 Tax=Cohnella cholangitidis TaxID=2598458 RepID=A0A7G5BYQ8_9BACL|nr:MerR family transcriptional regulator [Cohnella cholangitidis]QMV42092.1 MerR family DNA-binding transcriptional regulator [Cohnella cholangitidis]
MKANEVSKRTKLPISTLRFYERKKLIPEQFISRDENNYRVYDEEVVGYLQDLRMLLTLGFTIEELLLLINDSSHIEKKALVMDKIIYIQELEAKMEASKTFLKDVLEGQANFQTRCSSKH